MPYTVALPDGRVVEFPDTVPLDKAEALIRQQFPPTGEKKAGFSFRDLVTSFGQGAVGSTKALTDIAGAENVASQQLERASAALQERLSPERQAELRRQQERAERAAKSGSTWEEVKAAAQNIAEAPLQATAQAVGSFIPYIPTMFLGPAAAALGLGARATAAATAVARAAPAAIGTAQGAGAVKGAIYQRVYDAELKDGTPDAEARAKALAAQEYFGKNIDQILLGGGAGFVAGRFGAERLLTPGAAATAERALAGRVGTALATDVPTEAFQGGQEQLATNIALQREGRDVPTFEGVAGQATQEGLMGVLGTAPVAAVRGPSAAAERAAEESAAAAAAAQEELARNRPEALLKLESDFNAARDQLQALQTAAKKPGKGATQEQLDAYEEAKAAQNEFLSNTFRPLREEYENRKAAIARVKAQAAQAEETRAAETEVAAAAAQPTVAAPIPNAPPQLQVVSLMEQQGRLNSELEALQTQLVAAAEKGDTETIRTLTPLFQDLRQRLADRARLIEEQGGVAQPLETYKKEAASQLKALDKQLKAAQKALADAGTLGDFDKLESLSQKVDQLRAERERLGKEIETKTKMAEFVEQPKGTTTEMFGAAAPTDEAKVAEVKAAEAERAQYGRGSPTQAELPTPAATHKSTEVLQAEKAEVDKFVEDIFSLENRARVARGNTPITRTEQEQRALEAREEYRGQRRVRAAIFSDLIPDPKERERFKNGTNNRVILDEDGNKIRLQEVYDKGGEPAVEYEMVMDQIRKAKKQVTTKQGNAKKTLLEQLNETYADLEKLYAQRESGVAAPTMREKVAEAQAKLGKGEAPAARQMDASERFQLNRKIKGLETKYNMVFGKVAAVRDQVLSLQNSLYKVEPVAKRSTIKAEKARESRVYYTQAEQGAKAFLSALEKVSKPSTGETGLREINKIELDLKPSEFNDRTVYFRLIRALKGAEKGAASDVLRKVLELADRHGVRLELQVEQVGNTGLTAQQLEDWYARNGFKRGDMGMYRNPQPVEIQKVVKSRSAELAARYAKGDYRKEAEETQAMRDLAKQLGEDREEFTKAKNEVLRRYKALRDRYGKDDERVTEYKEFAKIELSDLATKLGKATPEYKATLKEQIAYMKEAYESAGKQEVKTKRVKAPVMRKQTSAPKETRTGSPESRARAQAIAQALQDAKEAIAREREEGVYGDTNWRDGEGRGGIDLVAAQKLIDGLKLPEGVKFKYVPTWNKVPVKVLKAAAEMGLTPDQLTDKKGAVLRDGSIYVFGEAHSDLKDLEQTIAHELIGHYAVERLLGGKAMKELLAKLQAQPGGMLKLADDLNVGQQVRAAIAEAKDSGASPEAAEMTGFRELYAYVEEQRPTASFMEKAGRFVKEMVGALRKALVNMGLLEFKTVSANDILKTLRDARTAFKEGTIGAYPGSDGGIQFRSSKITDPAVSAMIGEKPSLINTIKANVVGLGARQNFIDRWASIDKAITKGMRSGVLSSLEGEQAMYYLRFGEMRNMYVGQAMTNGVPRVVAERSSRGTEYIIKSRPGPNLMNVAELASKAKLGNEATTEAYLTAYIAGQRAMQIPNGWNKLSTDPAKAKAAYQAVVEKLNANPQAKKAFDDAVKEYQAYNNDLIDLLAEAGRIDRKKAALLKSAAYVPFYRVRNGEVEMMVDGEAVIRIGNIKNQPQLHELVGSNEKILPLYTSAMQNTAMIVGMSIDNLRTKNTTYALKKLGVVERIGDGAGPKDSPNKVQFYEHGKLKYAIIENDVYGIPASLMVKSMEGIVTSMPAAIKIMGIPADILRTFVTRNPAYAIRQAIRDPLAAWLTTGTDGIPVLSSLKELSKMAAGRSETEKKLMEAGAISSNVYTGDRADMDKFLRDMSAGKKGWSTLMSKLDAFAMQGDAATRAVVYNDSIKKGMTEMQALTRTLESMNFSRRGLSPSMQILSTLIPFFNAQIQGLDVLYRAAKGDMPYSERLKIQEKLIKRGVLLAGTAVMYAALMQDDEAYKKAKPEERYNNFFVRLPFFDEPVRVPIPFELGYIFKSIPEAVFNTAFGDEKAKDAIGGLSKLFAQSNPFALPQAIKPLTEVVLGKSFYSGDIESARERQMLPEYRYRESTSEIAKLIGSVTGDVGLSPIKLEYLVRGYTGSIGIAALQVLNPLLRSPAPEGEVQKPTTKTSELPIIGSLFQPNDGRGLVDAAYNRMEEINQAKRSVQRLVDEGKRAEAKELAQRFGNELALASVAGTVQQQLGTIAKQIRMVKASPTMSTEEKDAKIKRLTEAQQKLAERFVALVDKRI